MQSRKAFSIHPLAGVVRLVVIFLSPGMSGTIAIYPPANFVVGAGRAQGTRLRMARLFSE